MRRSGPVHDGLHYNRPMKFPGLAFLLSILLALPVLAAQADSRGRASPPVTERSLRAHAEGLSLDEAVARVEAEYGARAVRAREDHDGERRVYRIRLLSEDGRVFDVTVDAASGKVD